MMDELEEADMLTPINCERLAGLLPSKGPRRKRNAR